MEPYDFTSEGSKHHDYWHRSRFNASPVVGKYMDKYFKYACKNHIDIYTKGTKRDNLAW